MEIAYSVNGVPIRLTGERWEHIIERHFDLFNYKEAILAVIEQPEFIFQGRRGSLIATRSYGRRGILRVYYKEQRNDGFIITARFSDTQPKEVRIWPT
jgi:hypothetical protein